MPGPGTTGDQAGQNDGQQQFHFISDSSFLAEDLATLEAAGVETLCSHRCLGGRDVRLLRTLVAHPRSYEAAWHAFREDLVFQIGALACSFCFGASPKPWHRRARAFRTMVALRATRRRYLANRLPRYFGS
jgi:hypothetical protein